MGLLSCPVMLILILKDYLVQKIPVILYQSNQELDISLGLGMLLSQIAFSAMEAEYIALSQSMRDRIPLWEVIKEIYTNVFKKEFTPRCSTHSNEFFETIVKEYPASVLYEENAACLQFEKWQNFLIVPNILDCLFYWFINKVSSLEIDIQEVSSADQLADQFTKRLLSRKVWKFKKAHYGMVNAQKHVVFFLYLYLSLIYFI